MARMEFVVGLALLGGLAAAAYLFSRLQEREQPVQIAPVSASDTQDATDDPSARLLSLGTELSIAGDASSHPRDLESNATFRRAVAILKSPDTPLSVVTDFAAGANWVLATVACAALCGRSDRESARDMMTRQVRHLSPWALFYALRYFTALTDRPP